MLSKKLKAVIASIVLLFSASSVYAVEEYISRIYKELDQIFIEKSEDELNTVLSDNNTDKYYYLIENYTEKKIRRLIVNNDYDFAMTAIVVVIENNLDNETAVEMYTVIADAYDIQQQHEAEVAQQKQLELARVELEKEKQRGTVEKEYVAATKADSSGKQVYVTGKETKLTSYNWKMSLGLVDLLDLYDAVGGFNSIHYGISLDGRYNYTLENKMVVGGDVFGGFQFLSIADSDYLVPLLGDIEFALKLAPAAMNKLFFRAGLDAIITGKSSSATGAANVADTVYSPLVGIKYEGLELGSAKLDVGADWYAGHLFYENINFAMGFAANVQFPFAEMEKLKLNLNVGVRDKLFLKEDGIENRASVILAVGAENVIR